MSDNQQPLRLRVLCGGGDCFGPALAPFTIEEIGEVPFLSDSRYLLLKTLRPVSYQSDQIEYVVISPRYAGTSLEEIRSQGGTVGVARVRPNVQVDLSKGLQKDEVEYIAVGTCEVVEE